MRFLDTNVLLYAISADPGERDKTERANRILASRDVGLSVQVLQEFYVQATRATRRGALSHDHAARLVESFTRFPVLNLTPGLALAAMATCHRFQICYWDAAIIQAAAALRCGVVLSEDMNDGQVYDGVRVQNPFV